MNNTIIELKENALHNAQDSNYLIGNNGDYTCQIGEVTLNKGDQLQIKSAFIDQIAENTDLVTVEPDEEGGDTATLTMTYGYYICDWGGTPTDPITDSDGHVVTPAGTSLTRNTFIPTDLRPAQTVGNIPYLEGQSNGQLYIGSNVAFHSEDAQKANLSLLTGFNIGIIPNVNNKQTKDSAQKNIRAGYFVYEDIKSTDEKPIYHYLTIVFNKVGALKEYNKKDEFILIDNSNANTYIRYGKNDHVDGGPSTSSGVHFPLPMRRNSFRANIDPHSSKKSHKNGTYDHYVRMISNDQLNLGTLQEADMTAGGTYNISTFDMKVTIPAKSYDPEDLALQISTAFTQVDPSPLPSHEIQRNTFSTNNLITTTNNFNTNFVADPEQGYVPTGYPSVLTKGQIEQVFGNFVADDGYQIAQIQTIENNQVNQFIGTTNFDVHYDGSRFLIQQMHTPIYDNNGNNIVISLQAPQTKGGVTTVTRRFANKSSGIFITDLQPHYLWFTRMKFDDSLKAGGGGSRTLSVPNIPPNGDGSQVDCLVPTLNLIDGVNITGDLVSIGGVLVPPSNNEAINWQSAGNFNNRKTIESQQIPILGHLFNGDVDPKEKNGYYQLEIDCGINSSDIRGQDQSNNKIKAIISKFYTDKSYLSSYNEGAIPYTHNSDIPITLSQFKVRILDSKGRLASINNEIGNDNTVFMEIIRSNPELMALENPKKSK